MPFWKKDDERPLEDLPQRLREAGSEDLVTPVYLDTEFLLDLLASAEDGFSLGTSVKKRESEDSYSELNVEGKGDVNLPVLLGLTLGAGYMSGRGLTSGKEKQYERHHTYGSLLYKLRRDLIKADLLRHRYTGRPSWSETEASDFVELRGRFQPNPLEVSLQNLDRIAELVGSMRQRAPPQIQSSLPSDDEIATINSMVKPLLDDISHDEMSIFHVDMEEASNEYSAVVPIFTQYLRDETAREVSDKQFRILGRVVENHRPHSGSSVDLISGSGLGAFQGALDNLQSSFNEMEDAGVSLPEIRTEIPPPVLEISPIAVYT